MEKHLLTRAVRRQGRQRVPRWEQGQVVLYPPAKHKLRVRSVGGNASGFRLQPVAEGSRREVGFPRARATCK